MNKIVVITGASSGIGLELYKMYKAKGDTPISLSRTNPENLENFIQCDVSIEENVIECFKEIQRKYKTIDILINNAGFGINGAIELEHSSTVEKLMNVNFMGAFMCYKYALPLMKRGSTIVNISSVCAIFPLPFRAFYCASKAALSSISLAANMELKASGINVVTICPGQTQSDFDKKRIRNMETNERYQQTVEIANAKLKKSNKKRMKTSYVANIILKSSYQKHPKPMKIIGFKYKVLYLGQKILPMRWFLALTNKILA